MNPYLQIPLSRVVEDAKNAASLAREALAERDPAMAPEEANRKARIIAATGDYLSATLRR